MDDVNGNCRERDDKMEICFGGRGKIAIKTKKKKNAVLMMRATLI